MAGIDNDVNFGLGYRLQATSSTQYPLMQQLSTDIGEYNNAGTPESVVSANPGSLCHDRTNGVIYIKKSGTGNTGWQLVAQGTGIGETITGDSGGALSATANNWNIIGQQAGTVAVMDTIGAVSTLSVEDRSWQTRFVVDASSTVGLRGTFQTIAAAIAAASSGDTIYIRPGTYTEDLTLKDGVNLVSSVGQSIATSYPLTTIKGTHTITAGIISIKNIALVSKAIAAAIITTSGACTVTLTDCTIFYSTQPALVGASSGNFQLFNCVSPNAASGAGCLLSLTTANATLRNCDIQAAASPSTVAGSGSITILDSRFTEGVTTSDTSAFLCTNSYLGFSSTYTFGGTGSNIISNCYITSGSASAISVGTGATLSLTSSTILSSNTNAITGAGTLKYSAVTFIGTSSLINTTTQTPLYTNSGKHRASGQPAFFAYNTTAPQNVTGDGTTYSVVFDTELYDNDNNFASSTFTAPISGIYQFNAEVLMQNAIATMTAQINLVTTSQQYNCWNNGACWAGNNDLLLSKCVKMSAGDTATISVAFGGGTKVVDVYGTAGDPRTSFCGFLVG